MTHTNKFDLMIWETNPSKRNVNNEIKLYIDSNTDVNVGYYLNIEVNRRVVSSYEITEVIDVRKGAMRNKNYITAKTKWRKN